MPVRGVGNYTTDPGDLPEFWGIAKGEWNLQREVNVRHRYRKAALILHPDKHVLAPPAAQEGVKRLFAILQNAKDRADTYFGDMRMNRVRTTIDSKGVYFQELPNALQ
eukprot:6664930-Alexandrium_andersonii.AAC.1